MPNTTSKTKSKQTPGPAKLIASRDAEATKAQILDAAEEEFAQNGLAGARTEAIASRTGVTKAMLYYYFESKEGLYEAVLERAFLHRIQAVEALQPEAKTPTEALKLFVESFISHSANRHSIATILLYESMQNKGKYYKQVGVYSLYGTITNILERGMKTSEFRKLNAKHAAVNIVGMCVFYFCVRENLKYLWQGKDLLAKDMIDAHTKESIEMVLNGVRA